MAYDEQLTQRFRDATSNVKGITEKHMMGGVCFLHHGNMIGGADKGRFMFRVGKENEDIALENPGAEVMVQGGRKMSGLLFVDAEHVDSQALDDWISLALSFVETLPPK
ncbi:hypothetical protein GCE9029_00346 [Grimontia celer]|uniref:TfoX N-terminal domain-containing protein n=1 Tax=Grimontia celer TaxID=1796497 RepID=A0A128EUI9_9GAMM|nr:TfoX/Sxy family protein [Grimontia celer]CZF77671.1 hypothetical protein GCE9029_00346 [Grimontia celer]